MAKLVECLLQLMAEVWGRIRAGSNNYCNSNYCYSYKMKVSFWGLFKTNFYDHFRKLFLFTKFIGLTHPTL